MSIDRLQENDLRESGAHDEAQESVTPNQAINSSTNSSTTSSTDRVSAMQSDVATAWMRLMGIAIALLIALLFTYWGVHSLQHSDPYVQSVLQISGNPDRGKDIFTLNCATCHGLDANGEVGPDLSGVSERKSRTALIKQVISGQTPPMPQFQPNEKDMADLLSFLRTL